MSREIKFRGKRVDNGELVYGDLISDYPTAFGYQTMIFELCGSAIEKGGYFHPVIPESVGQYTSLKDKNGAEVYEGDRFAIDEDIMTVVFEDGIFALKGKNDKEHEADPLWCYENHSDLYIIGNIYDNPSLLEVQP